MKINKIAIACFKKDLFLLRPCVASIRYWYPDVEIYLIKDYSHGSFSTKEIEDTFQVKIFPTNNQEFGWGWGKFALVLDEKKDRYLFLDSDVVFLGKVLDELNQYDEEFIVTGIKENDKHSKTLNAHYIETQSVEQFDPSYQYPGFGFNTGQIVITSGIISKSDCASVLDFEPRFQSKYPELFKHADQGVLNYVLVKASQNGKAKIRYTDFWIWPETPEACKINLQNIQKKMGIPYILHWAGAKPIDFRKFARYDILKFYEDFYYSRVPMGKVKQLWNNTSRLCIIKLKIVKYTLFKQNYN